MNDYQILSLSGSERETVEEILYKKYSQLIYSKAIKYCHNKLYLDDYLNEARYILSKCIDTYNDCNSFITYLSKCLDNGLINFYNHEVCNKYKILNESIEIDDSIRYNVKEIVNTNPEDILIEEEQINKIIFKIKANLSWKEELVFDLKRQYYKNKEISLITDIKLRNIYNIINRIKNKMSKIM